MGEEEAVESNKYKQVKEEIEGGRSVVWKGRGSKGSWERKRQK